MIGRSSLSTEKKEARRGEAVQKKNDNNNYGKFKEGI